MGYTGGKNSAPSYESVCAGDGHTEAIRIEYDPSKVSYEDLLQYFWAGHSPAPTKTQYRSAIWYEGEDQREAAEAASSQRPRGKYVALKPVQPWYDAEEYHQEYYKKRCSIM